MQVKPKDASAQKSKILGLIKEYLDHSKFTRTSECLKMDVNNAGLSFSEPPKDLSSSLQTDILRNDLMGIFSDGEAEEFFSHFSRRVPKELQLLDKDCIIIVLELQLYFLVYPLRGNSDIKSFQERHKEFVRYLEDTASFNETIVNSPHARFLCLGLGAIAASPLDNFMVKELLNPSWSRGVKERLSEFLKRALPSKSEGPPQLQVLVEKNEQTSKPTDKQADKLADKQADTKLLEARCIQYKSMFVKQQKEYYNVLAVATELVESLENAILGKGVDPTTIERVCSQLFQPQVSSSLHNLDFTRPGTASNMLRQSMVVETKRREAVETSDTVAVLDIPRIKEVFKSGDIVEAAYLLQAVRWRITQSSTEVEREKLLSHCVNEDLFGRDDVEYCRHLLHRFLQSNSDLAALENFSRLVHCFCALSTGCVYLSNHSQLVEHLVDTMTSSTEDDVIRQVVLGALQTLSLTRHVQSLLLRTSDTITWLLNLLTDPDDLSEYTLHHTSALLMNLSLRTQGRLYLADNSTLLLTVVEGLLEHESSLVREYINGVLFSSLNMSVVREKARETGLGESVSMLIDICPEDTAQQLQFCLDQLEQPASEIDPSLGDSEDEEEEIVEDNPDSLTMDLQLPETLEPRTCQGEELLCSKYLTDIKLKLQHPVDTLVLDHPPQNSLRSSRGQSSELARAQGPELAPNVRTRSPVSRETIKPEIEKNAQRSRMASGGKDDFGPLSVPNAGNSALRHSQLGPGSRPDFRESEDVFIRNPDERPIKPSKNTPF